MAWYRRPIVWLAVAILIPFLIAVAIVVRGRMLAREQLAAWDRLALLEVDVREYLVRGETPRTPWQTWLEGHDVSVNTSTESGDFANLVDDIIRLRRVRGLSIASRISSADAERISQLPMLESLVVTSDAVNAEEIMTLCRSPGLSYLHLQHTQINDECLHVLAQLPRLQQVNLLYTDLSEGEVKALSAARPEIEIAWRPRQPEGVVPLDRLEGRPVVLRVVRPEGISRFADWKVEFTRQPDEETLALVSNLKNVREVTTWVGCTDEDLAILRKWPSLTRVNLLLASVTPAGVVRLSALPELNELAISANYTAHWTREDWQTLHEAMPTVKIHHFHH